MNKGFTLIELLMTIAILAIVMAIGIPSYRTLIQDNNLDARRSLLMRHLVLTRSEAVERKRRVTICGTNNALAANPTCAANWTMNQWVIFVEGPGGALGTFNAGSDTVIERYSPGSGNIVLQENYTGNAVTYSPDGTANINGAFTFRDAREAANCAASTAVSKTGRRCLVIANTGRVRIE